MPGCIHHLLADAIAHADSEAGKTIRQLHLQFAQGLLKINSALLNSSYVVKLSIREGEVARLVAFGFSNKQVAAGLGVSEATVKSTVKHIMQKTGLTDRMKFREIL